MANFKLSDKFIDGFKRKRAPFGFNGLGALVYMRTYSRIKDDGSNEQWWETVQRVVEGTYSMQKKSIDDNGLGWNAWQAQRSAQEMYERIFEMKFLPPGRGLWAMGTPITEEKNLYAALNNCAFVSTENLKDNLAKPFTFLMDASMLGVGVGFDTKGAGQLIVKGPNPNRTSETFTIPDTREGWVEAMKLLIESHLLGTAAMNFDYDSIRAEGEPIKGFGGTSSGYKPLKDAIDAIDKTLKDNEGAPITITTIVDIMNHIGKCVVAGNVRRCLPNHYEVQTEDGFKRMDELTKGDMVNTADGLREIKDVIDSGKQKVLKIKTMNNTEYEATEKHTLLVYNQDNGFEWKMVKDIDSDKDFLVEPK